MTKTRKFGFAFLFTYVILTTLIFPFEFIPYLDSLNNWINIPFNFITEKLWSNVSYNEHTFNYDEISLSDSYSNYLSLITKIILAFLISIFLMFFNFSQENYDKAKTFLFTYVRYYLATYMVIYGLAKIFLIQFNSLNLTSYLVPLGEYTPYDLFWAFMEISEPYQIIGGLLEVAGGVLLVNRKTVLIGALLIFGIMSNVFMFNLFYGITVKIISANFLFLSIILILYNVKSITKFIFALENTSPKKYPTFNIREKHPNIFLSMKAILIVYLLYFSLDNAYWQWELVKSHKDGQNLSGIFKIESSKKNGEDVSNFVNEAKNLRYIVFDRNLSGDFMQVHNFKEQKSFFYIDLDKQNSSINWKSQKDESKYFNYRFNSQENKLMLEGIWNSDTLKYEGIKMDKEKYLLMENRIKLIRQY